MVEVAMVPRERVMFDPQDKRKKCLNVGSGVDYKPSNETELWVNVDANPKVEPDIVCAAEELSNVFEVDTFDEVHTIHTLEHCEDTVKVMEEIWAVMKSGGKLISVCPHYTSENAFADPTHKRVITRITYAFFSYPVYEGNAKTGSHMSQLFPECDFDVVKLVAVPVRGDAKYKDEDFANKHYWNTIEELQAELTCVKPIRTFDIKQYQKRGVS